MSTIAHSEVLAHDWLPPVAFGRSREIDEVVRRLDPPIPRAPAPWIAAVAGPIGAGSSTVARRAAREVTERLRAVLGEPLPSLLTLRTSLLRGPHGVATALLQRFDEGFDGRGFPMAEVLAGLMRRIRRERRPTVLVLDDIGVGGPDLSPIVRAVADPDRFLPEGESGLPPLWTILAGTPEGLQRLAQDLEPRLQIGPFVRVDPYDPVCLRKIISDRAERVLGHVAPPAVVERVLTRTFEEGGGARRAVDLLRRELLGITFREIRDGVMPDRLRGVSIEPWVVRAIRVASHGQAARLSEVRRLEAVLAQAEGARPLPTTTLWRRIIRLEQAGYVRREIRPGGSGGTLSIVRVLTPFDEWVTTPHRLGSRPADVPWASAAVPRLAEPPSLAPVGLGPSGDAP